ncbi:Gfo/Idh/MocA family protein [Rhizobium sp. L1K21]|uniref:Gfo/Idh/MocA family protein n=1 Tax=Rhizobium sp. L1K21 TaxID=2954933 RepID=UPI0020931F73|nr:Gfo/Idh/MocA family oxidoreductase [Rhizobium sp. L1K21]MCO6188386.1 Gfo/Idh/MocA family oxidoreductase [Rhizobium sp. L1K21]
MVDFRSNGVRKLKLAVLGGGINSAVGMAHKHAIELTQRYEVVAGCFSRHDDVNGQTAALYGIEEHRTYKDLVTMLAAEKSEVDVLLILTPTRQHTEQVVKAFEAGIPVICEKALAGSIQEVHDIWRAGSDKSFLAVTFNYTGYPMVREARDMVQRGLLGELQQIHIEMPQEGFLKLGRNGQPIRPQDWRLVDGPISTVSLDLGVHVHSLLKFLTGRTPIDVCASGQSFGNFPGLTDNITAMVNCDGGFSCNMWYGKVALGACNGLGFRLYGSNGSLEWLQEFPENLKYADRLGHRINIDRSSPDLNIANQKRYERFKAGHPAGFIEAFANYYEDIADALIARLDGAVHVNADYVLGLPASLEGLELLDAVERSRKNRSWISLRPAAVSRDKSQDGATDLATVSA